MLHRTDLIIWIKENISSFDIDEILDDECVDSLNELTTKELQRIYNSKIQSVTKTKEQIVNNFTAHIIEEPKTRTVNIYIEDSKGRFLTADGKRHKRKMGEEMSLYMKMPKEIYSAIERTM